MQEILKEKKKRCNCTNAALTNGENQTFAIVFFPGVIFKAIACLYLYNFLCLCNLFFRLGVSLICDLYFFTGTLECLRPTCLAGGAFLVAGELSVGTTCLQMRPAHPHLLMLKKKETCLQMISSCQPFQSSLAAVKKKITKKKLWAQSA